MLFIKESKNRYLFYKFGSVVYTIKQIKIYLNNKDKEKKWDKFLEKDLY